MKKRVLSILLVITMVFSNSNIFAMSNETEIDGLLPIDLDIIENTDISIVKSADNELNNEEETEPITPTIPPQEQESDEWGYVFKVSLDEKYKIGENEYSIPKTVKKVKANVVIMKDGEVVPPSEYKNHWGSYNNKYDSFLDTEYVGLGWDNRNLEVYFTNVGNEHGTDNPYLIIDGLTKTGTATIQATFKNQYDYDTYSNDMKIHITKGIPTGVNLNRTKITTTKLNKKYTLTATVLPKKVYEDGYLQDNRLSNEDRTVKWSSSNKRIATVNSKGVVTTKGIGTATITATTTNGLKKNCSVKVKKANPTKVRLNKKKKQVVGYANTIKLKATVYPSNATNKKVKWSSSNKRIATVNSKGVVTTKCKKGSCTITAKTVNGKKAKVRIKVKSIKPKKIYLSTKNAGYTMTPQGFKYGDHSRQIKVRTKPKNANKNVKFKSSNKKIMTVSKSGIIKTKKKCGYVDITVTSKSNKRVKATFEGCVDKPVIYGGLNFLKNQGVLSYINKERKKKGNAPLKWVNDPDLEEWILKRTLTYADSITMHDQKEMINGKLQDWYESAMSFTGYAKKKTNAKPSINEIRTLTYGHVPEIITDPNIKYFCAYTAFCLSTERGWYFDGHYHNITIYRAWGDSDRPDLPVGQGGLIDE